MKFFRKLDPMMLYAMALYATIGIYQSYSSLYFASQGLDHTAVGLLQAAAPMTAIFAQPLWGYAADRSGNSRRVLRWLIFAAALAVALYPLAKTLWLMAAVVSLFALFQTSQQPLSDAIILDELNRREKSFGPIRVAQTLSFALTTWVAGRIFEVHGHWMPWATALFLLLSLAAAKTLPQPKKSQSARPRPFSLLKDKVLMRLIGLCCLLQITMGFFFSFYPIYFTEDIGGSRTQLGWAYLLGSLSELPFLLMADRLFDRLGVSRLLFVSAAAMLLRWVLLALFPNLAVAMVSQLLQGGGFVVMMFAMAKYIALHVPQKLRASGQTLLAMAGYGLSRVIGSLAGGWLSGLWGIRILFGISALLAAAVLYPLCRTNKRKT